MDAFPKGVAMALFALVVSACSSEPEGGQCQPCQDSTPRCDSGLTCRGFYNSQTIQELCATPATTQCSI